MSNGLNLSSKNNFPKLTEQLEREFASRMLKAAMRVHREVVTTLTGNRRGKEYRVPATKRTYRASQPFEPPATRLGHLRNSYKYIVKGNGFNAVGYVGSNLDYSHYLEYGTSQMKPRPHLKPAFLAAENDVIKIFGDLSE